MKKLIVCVSVLLICVTAICAFVACNEREPDLTGLNMAKDYLSAQLKDAPVDTNADFERPTALRNEHGSYTVAWTISVTSGDANGVKLGAEGTGVVTIDVDEMTTADIVYTLTATISDAEGNTVTLTFNHKVPKLNKVTVAELLTKEVDDTVYAIEGYVMASAANPGKTGSFVIADATGAIFSYNKFELNVGDKVLAFGTRSVNANLPQLGTTAVKVLEADSEGYAEATATELAAKDINLANLKEADMPVMAGTYYKITGVTLVKSEGYTNADYNGKQLLQLYTNDAMCDAAADLYGETVNIYGYVRGFKNGSYLTVQVSKIEYGGEGEFVPKTPAERVAHEKDALALDIITAAGEITLPATGERFSNVEITWTLAETTVATLANGKLTVAALPAVRTEITLTATLKCGEATDTKTITAIVREPWGELTNKVEGATLLSYTELGAKANDKAKYYTIGWVSKIENAKYGNIYIKNAEGKEFYVYGLYDCNGKVRFDALETKPIIGDVVVLYGEVTTYKDAPQLKNACMMQLNETVFTPATPEEPDETITTIANALVAANKDKSVTVSGIVKSISSPWNSEFNNMDYYLTDGTNTILVYRAGGAEVAVGDIVSVVGTVGQYNGVNQIVQGTSTKTGTHTCSTYTDANCENAAACTECGKTTGEALGHIDENPTDGVCDRCSTSMSSLKATATYSAGATGNMTGENDAATIGLDATIFSAISTKTGSNHVGLNKDGSIRLYKGASCELTISIAANYEIVSIKVTTISAEKSANGVLTVTDGTNTITAEAGVYAVNGNSVVLKNTSDASSNNQVWISSIEIVYAPVA